MTMVWPSWSDEKIENGGQKSFLTCPYLFSFVLFSKEWVALMSRVALRTLFSTEFPEAAC